MAIQIPTVYHLGFRYKFKLDWHDLNAKIIGKMMVPQTLGLGISQINLVIVTALASNLVPGSLAVFNFANNLQSFPVGIFGISFAIAAFPILAEHANNHHKLVANFAQTFRKILFFIIPATVLIIALRAQIIRVVLGSGKFNWQDTMLTMDTLGFFALSLFAQATTPLIIRVFYAKHDSATPFYIGLVTVIINTALACILAPHMGVTGLALAYSVDNILEFILLWIWLTRLIGNLDIVNIMTAVAKLTVSAIAGGGAAQIMKVLVLPYINMTKFSGVFIQLTAAGLTGLAVYAAFCYLLGSEELAEFTASLTKRWPFNKVKVGDQGEARGL
jgi:putative peptidoglycan lipid II flippase